MKIKKLDESNELHDRAKKHKKSKRGLSPYCTLNPDAGNVEHNVSMFNKMNSPVDSPSNNPVSGPHGGNIGGVSESISTPEEWVIIKKWNDARLSHRRCWYPRLYKVTSRTDKGVWFRAPGFAEDSYVAVRDVVYSFDNYEEANSKLSTMDEIIYETHDSLREERSMEFVDLHYDDLEVTIVTRPRRPSSYYFEYGRDEAKTVEETIDYDFAVPRSDIVDFIYENMTENDFEDIDTATEAEVLDFINKNFDTLFAKYESMILDYYREDAQEEAEMERCNEMNESFQMKESLSYESEQFLIELGQTQDEEIYQLYLSKVVDKNTDNELVQLNKSYNRYAKVQDDVKLEKIANKVKALLASCADRTTNESLSDRIRKNELDYDAEVDAYTATEGDVQVQFQDRETKTHEFRTSKNRYGGDYVSGQYNKHPKVSSNTWARVWKNGKLVKQMEGPKYKVRADMAKYLDADGKLDESKIPDNWIQYNGAWMYPVSGGWEANLDGLHYEAETEDELKAKIDRAVSDGWTKDKKLKQYFREGAIRYQVIVDAITPNYVVSEHEFLRDAIDAAKEEIDLNWASNVRIKDLSDGACWHDIENAEADLRDGIVTEAWSPELVDCPVCGDISFDPRKGRCTQCFYRESLDEFSDELDHPDQEFDSAKTSINSTKLPAVYKMVKIPQGTTGVDFGGGSFDNAVEHIRDLGATLCVYDPYNRSAIHNSEVIKTLRSNGGADWAINSNVLNVIKEPEARKAVLKNISRITKSGAPIYITVYEGRGDGQEGATKSGYQLNRKTQDYLAEIQDVFPDAVRKGKLITAHNVTASVNESNNSYRYKNCTIIDVGSGWKVKDASQNWIGSEFSTDKDAEEFIDSLKESFLDSDDNYEYVASKSVLDSDGFYTDYTWYKTVDGLNVFVFGDNDLYKPADGYIDHEEEDDSAAQEWFDSYNGFEEDIVDENLDTRNGVFCIDDQLEWTNLSGVKFRALVTDVNDEVVVLDMMPVGGTPVTKTFELTCDSSGKECIIADMASDKSDAVYVYPPHEDLEESTASNKVVYPNGEPVTDFDLDKALDYMYGTDRNPEWTYTDAEMQRAVYRWMDKVDPRPDGKSYMSLQEYYNIKFYQIFQAPSKPTENGKMIGQRDSLSAAIDFGEDRCGPGNFIIKGVCDDGRTRYVDFYKESCVNESKSINESEFKSIDEILQLLGGPDHFISALVDTAYAYPGIENDTDELADMVYSNYENIVSMEELESAVEYVIDSVIDDLNESKSINEGYNGVLLTDEDEELLALIADRYITSYPVSGSWETEAQHELEAIADGLNVSEEDAKKIMIDYLGFSEEQFNEGYEFSDDDVEDDLTHAAVYGGDSKYCKECGAVKKYDEDGFAYCPECCGELDESYWYNDLELRQKQDELIAELEADGFEETDGQSHGTKHWTFFRKRVDGKGVWKAIFIDTGSKEAAIIDVTYGQVRGYEPLDSFDALRKNLGKKLLP